MNRPRKPTTCLPTDRVLSPDYERIAERDRQRLAEIERLQAEHESEVRRKNAEAGDQDAGPAVMANGVRPRERRDTA